MGALRAAVLRSVVCAVAAAGAVVIGPGAAHATPAPLAEPTPSSVEAQIDQQWNALEPVIEEYNNVHSKLIKNQAQLKKLNATLGPLDAQVETALRDVQGLAVDEYMQGRPSAFQAMLVGGSPTGLLDKLTLLDQLAKHQKDQISSVATLRDKLRTTKDDLDRLTATVAARDADLSQRKTAIQKKIDALQKLRVQAYGAADPDDGPFKTGPCPVAYTRDKGGRAAQRACDLLGKPYVFGSDGPNSYDCSGLTKEAWAAVGVHLDHYTKDQWNQGAAVSRADLQPGDLVFYYPGSLHHVAIYIGGGLVVHAPHTGDHVRMATIDRGPNAG